MKRIPALFLFLYSFSCVSQGINLPFSRRYTGIGTYSSKFTDAFSFASNGAALAQATSLASGVYAERRFLLKELDRYSAVVAIPIRNGGLGFSALHTGSSHYRESELGLAYGRRLGERVDLGLQFNYYLVGITGYGNTGALHAAIGSIVHLTSELHAGVHVYNLLNSRLRTESGRKIPAVYTLGLGYELSDFLYMGAEVAKAEDQPVNVNIAMHYALIKQVFIRAGIATASTQFFFGTGIKWRNVRLDLVGSHHPQLGITPSILLIFTRQKERE